MTEDYYNEWASSFSYIDKFGILIGVSSFATSNIPYVGKVVACVAAMYSIDTFLDKVLLEEEADEPIFQLVKYTLEFIAEGNPWLGTFYMVNTLFKR